MMRAVLGVGTVEQVREAVAQARRQGRPVGLVPTMGALHAGHASLLQAARAECGLVVASIFVNPTQFSPAEDLARYPRPIEEDLALCGREQVDMVFMPTPEIMYPAGFRTDVEVHGLQDLWEGASRPGHFRGVATIVLKLFNIVQPDIAYFGQKDGQQVRIIRQLVRDLNVPIQLRICPTVREADGLALSSRNVYLSTEQRRLAPVLFRALEAARQRIEAGEADAARVRRGMIERIEETPGAVLDYAAVVDEDTWELLELLQGDVVLALAVKFGATRLIDNMPLSVPAEGVQGA